MRVLLSCLILLYSSTLASSLAQSITAVNEDSTRQVSFKLSQGVQCEVEVTGKSVVVRGKLASIDSASFQLKLGDGYYTSIRFDQLLRMRHRHYARQRLTGTGAGSGLLGGNGVTSKALLPVVAVAALTGAGIAALSPQQATFRPRDPSSYRGWRFWASLPK
jgi:hypothetical protein